MHPAASVLPWASHFICTETSQRQQILHKHCQHKSSGPTSPSATFRQPWDTKGLYFQMSRRFHPVKGVGALSLAHLQLNWDSTMQIWLLVKWFGATRGLTVWEMTDPHNTLWNQKPPISPGENDRCVNQSFSKKDTEVFGEKTSVQFLPSKKEKCSIKFIKLNWGKLPSN